MNIKTHLFIILLTTFKLNGQVTIGSDASSSPGAILDLKEYSSKPNGQNSDRGLGLPRIGLTTASNLTDVEVNINNPGVDKYEYTGLTVYNTGNKGGLCPGIHVWTGEKWEPLTPAKMPDITVQDSDKNTYTAKWFGTSQCDNNTGAYWMTQNLYTTTNKNTPPTNTMKVYLNPARHTNTGSGAVEINNRTELGNKSILYREGGSSSVPVKESKGLEFAEKFGLLYKQSQAIDACPEGWEVPTNQDWESLIKIIDKETSNPTINTNTAGQYMRANRDFYGDKTTSTSTISQWGSTDSNVTVSGFNAYPSGYKNAGPDAGYFGQNSVWWSATLDTSSGRYNIFILEKDSKKLTMSSGTANGYSHSVRCIKKLP